MSVKKHYQKRNQELNKDLMKRWGYTPPEKPIDEGLFDSLQGGAIGKKQQQLADLGGDPDFDINKYLNRDSTSDGTKDTSDVEEKADDMPAVLKSQMKKLSAFANQTLRSLKDAGISQEDKIYKDIVKSMNDAIDSLKVTGTEVSSATDSPQSDEQNQNYKENIAKIVKSQYGEEISTFNKNLEPKLANLDNEKLMNFFQANLLRTMEIMMDDDDLDPGMVVSDAQGPGGERMKISTAVENLKNLFKKLQTAGAHQNQDIQNSFELGIQKAEVQKEIYNLLQAVPNIGKLGLRNGAKKIIDTLIQNLPSGLELEPRPEQPGDKFQFPSAGGFSKP